MNLNLKETKVSMTQSRLILRMRKNRARILLIIPLILIFAALLMHIRYISTDKNDFTESEKSDIKVAMNWYHYNYFDTSDPHMVVRLDTTSDEIYLDNNSAKLQYTVSVYPKWIRNQVEYEWNTSNDIAAPIDNYGLVSSAVPGEADISINVKYGDTQISDTAKLRIVQPADGIYMPTTTVNIYNGGSGMMIAAAASPENASNKKLIWRSDDEKIATVDEHGFVKPVKVGVTKVHAVTEDGGYEAQCFVNVINYAVKVDSVTIENEFKDDARLKAGELMKLTAAVAPANAKNKTLKWTSTNSSVASVSQTGIVRASEPGETYIIADSNGKQDMMKLTVEPNGEGDRLNLYKEDENTSSYTPYTGAADGTVTYTNYSKTLDEMVDIQMSNSTPPKVNGGNGYASRTDVWQCMNPEYYHDGAYKYQFLDLSHSNNVSADELNKYLSGKGVLSGHAQDFIDAAQQYNVSELYLVAHALLETGNGTSALARGIEVNGTTVYNVFGIGAYDNSAVYSGSQKAYREGWTSVGAAIKGGAKFISDMYVNASESRQNTLYKMLFNPANPGQHQYATDCEWAINQATILDRLFTMFPSAVKTYEVPVYAGMTPVVLDVNN